MCIRDRIVAEQVGTPRLVDVNGDGSITALDALLVINAISDEAIGLSEDVIAEGEFVQSGLPEIELAQSEQVSDILASGNLTGGILASDFLLSEVETFEPSELVVDASGADAPGVNAPGAGSSELPSVSLESEEEGDDDSAADAQELGGEVESAIDAVFAEIGSSL